MKNSLKSIISDLLFLVGSTLIFLIDFSALRAILLYRNFDLATEIPVADLDQSFITGFKQTQQ